MAGEEDNARSARMFEHERNKLAVPGLTLLPTELLLQRQARKDQHQHQHQHLTPAPAFRTCTCSLITCTRTCNKLQWFVQAPTATVTATVAVLTVTVATMT
jgi:hypothetical protein